MSQTSSTSQGGKTTRALIIWPDDAELKPVKDAVIAMGLPYRVTPFKVHQEKDGRVLVLEDGFPLLRDHIYPKSPALMEKAIRWALGEVELERGPKLFKDNLDAAIGGVTVELDPWTVTGEDHVDAPW